jgi:hypothetical protein
MADILKIFHLSVDIEVGLKTKDYLKTQEILLKELALLEDKNNSAVIEELPRLAKKNSQEKEELRENFLKISEQSNELIKIMKKKNSGLHSQIRTLEVIRI